MGALGSHFHRGRLRPDPGQRGGFSDAGRPASLADDQLAVVWKRTYDPLTDVAAAGIVAVDGGLAIVGSGRPTASAALDVLGVRTDLYGNLLYFRTEALDKDQTLAAAAALPDGGLVAVGTAAAAVGADVLILRTNAWGYGFCSALGDCLTTSPASCDDGSPCTAENCTAALGCQHNPLVQGAMCSDTGKCSSGKCL